MAKISGQARKLRIYIGENSKYLGKPLYQAIVLKAKEMGMAGASVFRGIEGFGPSSRIKTARLLDLSADLPILVEIVDGVEYIDLFMPFLDEAVNEGMITVEDVDLIKYQSKPS